MNLSYDVLSRWNYKLSELASISARIDGSERVMGIEAFSVFCIPLGGICIYVSFQLSDEGFERIDGYSFQKNI